jgi:hypothetical protein
MTKLMRFLAALIFFIQCTVVFSRRVSQEIEPSIPGAVAGIASMDSWKCTEYIPNIDPICRFRAIYINPLKSETSPRMEVEILEWVSYIDPTMRLLAKKSIDVNSNDQTASAAGKLEGEPGIGCCSRENIHWQGLRPKYDMQVGKKMFHCELNRLAEKKFGVDCKDSIEK